MLLVFLRAEVTARQCQDQRIAALKLAQGADGGRVVRQRVIGEDAARDDVGTQPMTASQSVARLDRHGARRRLLAKDLPVHARSPNQRAAPVALSALVRPL